MEEMLVPGRVAAMACAASVLVAYRAMSLPSAHWWMLVQVGFIGCFLDVVVPGSWWSIGIRRQCVVGL